MEYNVDTFGTSRIQSFVIEIITEIRVVTNGIQYWYVGTSRIQLL